MDVQTQQQYQPVFLASGPAPIALARPRIPWKLIAVAGGSFLIVFAVGFFWLGVQFAAREIGAAQRERDNAIQQKKTLEAEKSAYCSNTPTAPKTEPQPQPAGYVY